MNSLLFSWRACVSLLYMHILYTVHLLLDQYSFYHNLPFFNQILITTILVILPYWIYIKWVFANKTLVSNQWSFIYGILLLIILFSFKVFIPEFHLFQLGFSLINLLILGISQMSFNESQADN